MTAPKRQPPDWDGVKKKYPSTQFDEKQWLAVFDANPDIMWRIVGDICKAVIATESEVRRNGRRPTPNLSLADVERILSPNYSMEPFPAALASLMAGRSQRAFAARVPVHHHTLRRLLTGEIAPSLPMMASLAKAGRVEPHYFVEYRAQAIAKVLEEHFADHPNQSIRVFKEIRRAVEL
ncbi:MAG: helix-turn-helix domain-containing protein [Oryzihumus sp.]